MLSPALLAGPRLLRPGSWPTSDIWRAQPGPGAVAAAPALCFGEQAVIESYSADSNQGEHSLCHAFGSPSFAHPP